MPAIPPIPGSPNLTRRLIDIPGDGANPAFIPVYATGPVRAWRFQESIVTKGGAAASAEGFQVKIPNDGSATGFTTIFQRPAYSTTNEPGEFPFFENWHHISEHGPCGDAIGGAGNTQSAAIGPTTATLLFYVSSLTGTGTTIELVEYF